MRQDFKNMQLAGRCGGADGKTSFINRADAKAAAKALERKAIAKTGRVFVYHCELCDNFHLTSMHPEQAKIMKSERARRIG